MYLAEGDPPLLAREGGSPSPRPPSPPPARFIQGNENYGYAAAFLR